MVIVPKAIEQFLKFGLGNPYLLFKSRGPMGRISKCSAKNTTI
jgi:hypothetical protein